MERRRQFLKTSVGFLAGVSILLNPLFEEESPLDLPGFFCHPW